MSTTITTKSVRILLDDINKRTDDSVTFFLEHNETQGYVLRLRTQDGGEKHISPCYRNLKAIYEQAHTLHNTLPYTK